MKVIKLYSVRFDGVALMLLTEAIINKLILLSRCRYRKVISKRLKKAEVKMNDWHYRHIRDSRVWVW